MLCRPLQGICNTAKFVTYSPTWPFVEIIRRKHKMRDGRPNHAGANHLASRASSLPRLLESLQSQEIFRERLPSSLPSTTERN